MSDVVEVVSKCVEDTYDFAQKISKCIDEKGAVIFFLGEIGAGKTTFIKKLLENFGVTEDVTSPSFVVMNEYHSAKIPVYHFDFYRLENLGTKTIRDELFEYSDEGNLLLIEWAQFNDTDIFDDKIIFNIDYQEDETRKITLSATGKNSAEIIKRVKQYENS